MSQQSSVPSPADSTQSPHSTEQGHPALSHRPPPNPAEGKIKLDVLVTDNSGRPIEGLEQKNFTLLDNKKPQPIVSFRAVDGLKGAGKGEPPVEVILLVDVTNTSLRVVGYERSQIENFLRRNGGKLIHPTSVMIFNEQGVKGQLQPTMDGNRLADDLNKAGTTVHTVPFTIEHDPDRLTMSLNALQLIIQAEAKRPGRTILIWIGERWPMLESSFYQFTKRNFQGQFDQVVTASNGLRESRITLYSIYPIDSGIDRRAACPALPQLLERSAFCESGPTWRSRVARARHSQRRACTGYSRRSGRSDSQRIAEAQSYYTLTFDPATAKHVDEYHELVVRVDKPELKARTSAGYYAEPTFLFTLPALSVQH
jgi:hypothetical protein